MTRRTRLAGWLLVGFALLPVAAVVLTRTGRAWLPVHDVAVIDMRTRDVFTADTPLVGAYSRYGWNHPGPWQYWIVGAPAKLVGSPAWATLVGAAIVQGVALALLAWFAWRRGGLGLTALVLAITALAYGATGPWILLEPWNPHVAFPWFILVGFLAWLVATGEARRVPWLVAAASFLVQAHVGYAPFVAVLGGWALLCLVLDARARRFELDPAALRRPLLVAAAIAAVLWLPVAVEQLARSPGNLNRVAGYFRGSLPIIGVGEALGILAGQFRVPPPWLGGTTPVSFFDQSSRPVSAAWLVIPLALLAAAAWASRGPRRRRDRRAVALVALALGTGALALSRVTAPPFAYLSYWQIPVAVATVVVCVTVVARRLPPATRTALAPVGVCVFGAAVVVPNLVLAGRIATHGAEVMPLEGETAALLDQLVARGLPDAPVLVQFAGSPIGGVHGGLFDELDRRGVPVRVPEDAGFQYGEGRGASLDDVAEVWLVAEEGLLGDELAASPGARPVAAVTPLDAATEAELRAAQRRVAAQLRAAGRADQVAALDTTLAPFTLADVPGVDGRLLGRIGAINTEIGGASCRCRVVAFDPDDIDPATLLPRGAPPRG